MKIRAPFEITRERFAEKRGEVAFVLHAWVHGNPQNRDEEEDFRRGHCGVMLFLGGKAVYHGYGGFERDGTFVEWGKTPPATPGWSKSRFA